MKRVIFQHSPTASHAGFERQTVRSCRICLLDSTGAGYGSLTAETVPAVSLTQPADSVRFPKHQFASCQQRATEIPRERRPHASRAFSRSAESARRCRYRPKTGLSRADLERRVARRDLVTAPRSSTSQPARRNGRFRAGRRAASARRESARRAGATDGGKFHPRAPVREKCPHSEGEGCAMAAIHNCTFLCRLIYVCKYALLSEMSDRM